MKITFRQSGGYTGLIRGAELDTETLPTEAAKALQSLMTPNGLRYPPEARSASARDLISYEITVETDEGFRRIMLNDATVGPELEPLIEYLQDRAQPVAAR